MVLAASEIATLVGVPDYATGPRLFSTGLRQYLRASWCVVRYRQLSVEAQVVMLRRVGVAIAAGDAAVTRLREAKNHDALRQVIRERDYWIEVAYRILALAPAKLAPAKTDPAAELPRFSPVSYRNS